MPIGLGNERFKEMLSRFAQDDLPAQSDAFEKLLAVQRGDHRQRDDITLIGFRL